MYGNLLAPTTNSVHCTTYLYLVCVAVPHQMQVVDVASRRTTPQPSCNLAPHSMWPPVVHIKDLQSIENLSNMDSQFIVIPSPAMLASLRTPTTTTSNLSTILLCVAESSKWSMHTSSLHANSEK